MIFAKIDKDLMRLVSTPMGASIAYNPEQGKAKAKAKAKSKGKKAAAKADPTSERDSKRRKKTASAAAASTSAAAQSIHVPEESLDVRTLGEDIAMPDDECDEVAADTFEGDEVGGFDDGLESFRMSHVFEDPGKAPPGSKTREKTFLDDVLQVFNHVVHSQKAWLNEPCFEKPLLQIRAIIMSVALEFCFASSVHLNNKHYKTWSALRAELRVLIVDCLQKIKTVTSESVPDAGAAAAAVNEAVKARGVATAGSTEKSCLVSRTCRYDMISIDCFLHLACGCKSYV